MRNDRRRASRSSCSGPGRSGRPGGNPLLWSRQVDRRIFANGPIDQHGVTTARRLRSRRPGGSCQAARASVLPAESASATTSGQLPGFSTVHDDVMHVGAIAGGLRRPHPLSSVKLVGTSSTGAISTRCTAPDTRTASRIPDQVCRSASRSRTPPARAGPMDCPRSFSGNPMRSCRSRAA